MNIEYKMWECCIVVVCIACGGLLYMTYEVIKDHNRLIHGLPRVKKNQKKSAKW